MCCVVKRSGAPASGQSLARALFSEETNIQNERSCTLVAGDLSGATRRKVIFSERIPDTEGRFFR